MSQIRFAKLHHAFANGATAKVNQRVSKDTTDSNVDMHSSQCLKRLKKSHYTTLRAKRAKIFKSSRKIIMIDLYAKDQRGLTLFH